MLRRINNAGFIGCKVAIAALSLSLLLLGGCGQQGQTQSTQLLGQFTLEVPMAYVKRPIDPINDINPLGNPRHPMNFTPGGNLYYRDVASSESKEINITGAITAADPQNNKDTPGDVADPSVSYDGTKIVFAMKIGEFNNLQPEQQPTWNIWEYDVTTKSLRRVIPEGSGDLIAEQGNDVAPAYLPDGRIVFLSDRQETTRGILTQNGQNSDTPYLDEDRRDPAFVLHVMDPSGDQNSIHQLSFNQSDDLSPSVLSNGKIVFSRWEHAAGRNQVDLFQVNPDGTDLNILYGAYSHNTADGSDRVFLNPLEMPDGRLIASLMPNNASIDRGDMVYIDYKNYVDIHTPIITSTSSQSQGQVSATGSEVPVSNGLSRYGRYANPFPLWDGTNRILVSWSPCLAQLDNGDSTVVNTNPVVPCPSDTTGYVPATPLYHIVIVDLNHKTQKPIVPPEDGMAILQPVALVKRSNSTPATIPDKTVLNGELDQQMASDNVGAIDIRSVYDTTSFTAIGMQAARLFNNERLPCNTPDLSCADGDTVLLSKIANPDYVTTPFAGATTPEHPARFVRIVTAVPTPPMIPRFAYGISGNEMREIAGYAPVEPDGSVYTEVPANVPFAVEVLDASGRKLHSHNDWLQVRPGETLKCNGCHSPSDGSASINPGATATGSTQYFDFNVDSGMADMNASVPQVGDTMAETRVRMSCETGNKFCDARVLLGDLVYTDVWTSPPTGIPEISIKYKDTPDLGLTPPSPQYPVVKSGVSDSIVSNQCIVGTSTAAKWTYDCRIVINYLDHIQPLWDRDRWVDAAGNLTDQASSVANDKCTICHSDTAADGVTAQIPAGARQLDLTTMDSTAAIQNPNDNWNTSYQELFLDKFEREIDATGALVVSQDCSLQDTDNNPATPDVLVCTNRPLSTGSPISTFSARRSYLIEKMTETELGAGRSLTTTVDHSKMMTPAEIRLLSEWIDMGAPYYSDPYAVPMN